jgi:hypothetical protein
MLEKLNPSSTIRQVTDERGGITVIHPLKRVRENQWKLMFQNIPQAPIEIETFKFDDDMREDAFLRPYDMNDIRKSEFHDFMAARIASETPQGGMMNLENVALAVMTSIGEDVVNLPPIQWLSYYLARCEYAPYIHDRGKITHPYLDAMAASRIFVLLNGAHMAVGIGKIPMNLWWSVIAFIFKDPYTNSEKMKSTTHILNIAGLSLSKTGKKLVWRYNYDRGPPTEDPVEVEYTGPSDHVFFNSMRTQIYESLADLRSYGLSALADFYVSLFDAPVNEANIAAFTALRNFPSIAGYSDSYIPTSFKMQLDTEHPVGPAPMKDYIRITTETAITMAGREGKIPKESEFLANIFNYATSKASGKRGEWQAVVNGRWRQMSSTSKRILIAMFGIDILDKDLVETPTSLDNPGVAASRKVVGGKLVRAIFIIFVWWYLLEMLIAIPIEWWMKKREEFTSAHLTGFIFTDHRRAFAATTDPNIVIACADYSKFDTSLKQYNAKQPYYEGILAGFNRLGISGRKFLHWTYETVITKVLNAKGIGYDTVWKIGDEFRTVDQVDSGKRQTAIIGSISNYGNIEVVKERLPIASQGRLKMQSYEVMGDDSIILVKAPNSYDESDRSTISNTFINVSKENGLTSNEIKNSLMLNYFEYLKIYGRFGYHEPLLWIQIFGGERDEANAPTAEMMRAYRAKLLTAARRGYDEELIRRTLCIVWRIKSGVKVRGRKGVDGPSWYYMPFDLLFAPMMHGGIGFDPRSIFGVNADGIIAYRSRHWSEEFKASVERSMHIANAFKTRIREDTAKSIIEGNVRPAGSFERGVDLLNNSLIPSRLKVSDSLHRRWARYNHLKYSKMPKRIIEKTIADDNSLRKLALADQDQSGEPMRLAELSGVRLDIMKGMEWIKHFDLIKEGELVETHKFNPIPALGYKSKRALRIFGGRGSVNMGLVTSNELLKPLRSDPYGRRDISDVELISILSTPGHTIEDNSGILQYMGFSESAAQSTATLFSERSGSYIISDNATPYSGNDGFIQMFNLDVSELKENILTLDTSGNAALDTSLMMICVMEAFYEGFNTGVYPKFHIKLYNDSPGRMLQSILNNVPWTRSLHLNNVYPSRTWTEKTAR